MDDEAGTDPRARRRVSPVALIAGGLTVVVAVVLVVVLLAGDDEDEAAAPTYTDSTEEAFLVACTADGGDPVRPVCQCLYDGLVETIPYERYDEVNDLLLAAPPAPGDPLALPDDFEEILAGCRLTNPEGGDPAASDPTTSATSEP